MTQPILNADIMREVIPHISFSALQEFALAAPVHERWVTKHLNLAFNDALRAYVQDPSGFRAAMRLTGAVISGSFALAFIVNEETLSFAARDMDVYAPHEHATRFMKYLVDAEGYTHHSSTVRGYGRSAGHALVMRLSKHDRNIDVVASRTESALFPIAHFWASHLMNYLSADFYCVAYPTLTFARRLLLSPVQLIDKRYPSTYLKTVMQKYEKRGFQFRVRPYAWADSKTCSTLDPDTGCPVLRRFFGDRFCRVGALSPQYVPALAERGLPSTATVCWWRGGDPCGEECALNTLLPERKYPGAAVLYEHDIAEEL